MVTENICANYRKGLGREIGEVKERLMDAEKCTRGKVDKATFRWVIGILAAVLLAAISAGAAGMTTLAATRSDVTGLDKRMTRLEVSIDRVGEKLDRILEKLP